MYFVVLPWKQVASQSLCKERHLIFSYSDLFLQAVLGDVGSYDNKRWIKLKRGCGVIFEGGHPSRNEERISHFPLYNESVFSCACWQCLRSQSWDALPCFRKSNIFSPWVCLLQNFSFLLLYIERYLSNSVWSQMGRNSWDSSQGKNKIKQLP